MPRRDDSEEITKDQLLSELASWTHNYLSEGVDPQTVFEALADLSYALYANYKKQIDLEEADMPFEFEADIPEPENETPVVFTPRKKKFWEEDSIDVIPLLKAIHKSHTVEDFLSLAQFKEH